jgi:hypothetical protein
MRTQFAPVFQSWKTFAVNISPDGHFIDASKDNFFAAFIIEVSSGNSESGEDLHWWQK